MLFLEANLAEARDLSQHVGTQREKSGHTERGGGEGYGSENERGQKGRGSSQDGTGGHAKKEGSRGPDRTPRTHGRGKRTKGGGGKEREGPSQKKEVALSCGHRSPGGLPAPSIVALSRFQQHLAHAAPTPSDLIDSKKLSFLQGLSLVIIAAPYTASLRDHGMPPFSGVVRQYSCGGTRSTTWPISCEV